MLSARVSKAHVSSFPGSFLSIFPLKTQHLPGCWIYVPSHQPPKPSHGFFLFFSFLSTSPDKRSAGTFVKMIFIVFWPHRAACGILVPQAGTEPAAPAVEARSLNHWTAREVPPSDGFYAALAVGPTSSSLPPPCATATLGNGTHLWCLFLCPLSWMSPLPSPPSSSLSPSRSSIHPSRLGLVLPLLRSFPQTLCKLFTDSCVAPLAFYLHSFLSLLV